MKLQNTKIELKLLRTILCDKPISNQAFASTHDDMFYYVPAKQAWHRIKQWIKESGELPDYSTICNDPTIDERSRDILSSTKVKAAKDKTDLSRIVEQANVYRQLRGLYELFDTGITELQEHSVDPQNLLELVSSTALALRSKTSTVNSLKNIGTGNNSSDIVKQILDDKEDDVLPTGFKNWDVKLNNRGFPNGRLNNGGGILALLASISGGGKSLVAGQLAKNFSRVTDTVLCGFEMDHKSYMSRMLSNLTKIPINKFKGGQLTKNEKALIKKHYSKLVKRNKKSGTKLSIYVPPEDITMEDLLFQLKPYGYGVIIIDYITLLKGLSGDDQAKRISEAGRLAKRFAATTGTNVIILCQLSDDDLIRYSRGINEHADLSWIWSVTMEDKERGVVEIRQPKARNYNPTPWYMQIDYEIMRASDSDETYSKKDSGLDDAERYLADATDDED